MSENKISKLSENNINMKKKNITSEKNRPFLRIVTITVLRHAAQKLRIYKSGLFENNIACVRISLQI